jgi:NADH dehydrogenase
VEVILNTRLEAANLDSVRLNDGSIISCHTLIWAGGGKPDQLISSLPCNHDNAGRVITNNNLEVEGYDNVFSLGDCACIIDPNTGKPYPPTAQHALRQGKVAASNIVTAVRRGVVVKGRQQNKEVFITRQKV